ncbi:hypothetical protein OCU04_004131 [Sclerotinia nivalis]|uniref:Uncharacterized protein n=1 Tax=Sclerotinia nivalis TaxID=352851 RepID=A0A9X0APU4_9HELO|nr:hypothetical protein OCU04_004131 [Sclerotinia nivalis]
MPDYPGLGLSLRYDPQDNRENRSHYPIGVHGDCWGAISKLILVRELAMMSVMDRLTDKEEWHKKVFDEEIVSKWREEALAIPDEQFCNIAIRDKHQFWNKEGKVKLSDDNMFGKGLAGIMNANSFDCCIKELQSKAKYYEKTGIIPTLDACASIAKSDNLVSEDLHNSLRKAFDTLKSDQSSSLDWHPNSNDMVQDLVHPSMYPLVYGRSRVLKDEVVGVNDAIEKWVGKGSFGGVKYEPKGHSFSGDKQHYWSNTYQWLPANVAFQEDGKVKFTSYINNIHPTKYPEIYHTIEKLVETALPLWDQCLTVAVNYEEKDGAGRIEPRFPYPENPDDENGDNWILSGPRAAAHVVESPTMEVDDQNENDHGNGGEVDINIEDTDSEEDEEDEEDAEEKWRLLRKPVIPEPSFEDVNYSREPKKCLSKKFEKSGLQVIVKIASIELTPEKPEFPMGGWHIEGQMNEHICGTALYYLDSENITSSDLSFRMQTMEDLYDDFKVGLNAYDWLEQVYGTNLGQQNSPCLQNYGSVETRQGRLLAFPNVFQHKVSSFRLKDPTKPGHRRFIALWLVDPHVRIISTANVPPQQMDWWLESVFGDTPEARSKAMGKLPAELVTLLNENGLHTNNSAKDMKLSPELMEMVRKHFHVDSNPLPMGIEEAKEHRINLMRERSAFVRRAGEEWQSIGYSFCEH